MSKEEESVLLLHSNCTLDGKSWNLSGSLEFESLLGRLAISCDLLLLPELPEDDASRSSTWSTFTTTMRSFLWPPKSSTDLATLKDESSSHFVEFLNTPLNPCGVSNVLAWKHLTWERVLFSLTSCGTMMDAETGPRWIPVEASPASHCFAWEASAGDVTTTAEVSVSFDLRHVRDFLLLQEGDDTNTTQNSKNAVKNVVDNANLQEDGSKHGECEFGSEASFGKSQDTVADLLDSASFDPTISTPTSATAFEDSALPPTATMALNHSTARGIRLEEEVETWNRIYASLERDAANLDRCLQIVWIVGWCLLVALVWAAYQVCQDKKDQPHKEKLLRSIQDKLVLQQTLSASPGTSHVRSLATTFEQSGTLQDDNMSQESVGSPEAKDATTHRHAPTASKQASDGVGTGPTINDIATTTTDTKTISPAAASRDDRSSTHPCPRERNTTKMTQKPPKGSSKITASDLQQVRKKMDRRNRMNTTTTSSKRAVVTPERGTTRLDNKDLSPCSKLAQEWAARQQQGSCSKQQLPLRPRLDESSLSQVPPPIPDLVCTTPGSADSFVDDYW